MALTLLVADCERDGTYSELDAGACDLILESVYCAKVYQFLVVSVVFDPALELVLRGVVMIIQCFSVNNEHSLTHPRCREGIHNFSKHVTLASAGMCGAILAVLGLPSTDISVLL